MGRPNGREPISTALDRIRASGTPGAGVRLGRGGTSLSPRCAARHADRGAAPPRHGTRSERHRAHVGERRLRTMASRLRGEGSIERNIERPDAPTSGDRGRGATRISAPRDAAAAGRHPDVHVGSRRRWYGPHRDPRRSGCIRVSARVAGTAPTACCRSVRRLGQRQELLDVVVEEPYWPHRRADQERASDHGPVLEEHPPDRIQRLGVRPGKPVGKHPRPHLP